MEDLVYTVSEVAELLKVNRNYVYGLIKSGLLPCLKLGSIKIRRQAVVDFLEKFEGMDLSDPACIREIA